MKTIGITGATGQLGRMIVEELLKTFPANQVVLLARDPHKAVSKFENGVIVRQGNYDDFDSLVKAFEGVTDLMFISGSEISKRLTQHKNVIEAAQQAGVEHIVYTSFLNLEGEGTLATQHRQTEAWLKASGIPNTILRPSFYMDMMVMTVQQAMENGFYLTTNKNAGASYISRWDIARSAVAVLLGEEQDAKLYELTGQELVTGKMIAETASALSTTEVRLEEVTPEQLAEIYRQQGINEGAIQMMLGMEASIAGNQLAKITSDVEKLTGQAPVTFSDFVKAALSV